MQKYALIALLVITSPITAHAGESSIEVSTTSGPKGNSTTVVYKYTW